MLAYLNNPKLRTFVLTQLGAHREADRLVKGHYWENGKGCAVGCTLESVRLFNGNSKKQIRHGDHSAYERELGIPRILAELEDRFFENLPNGESKTWPERFAGAIRVGADLSMAWPRFAHWLLSEEVPQFVKREQTRVALVEVAALYQEWINGSKPHTDRWLAVRKNADASAASAAAAAAAVTAASAAAAYAAAAAFAAFAAAAAVTASAYAAYAAAAYAFASVSASDAWTASYRRQSDKLIEILEAA